MRVRRLLLYTAPLLLLAAPLRQFEAAQEGSPDAALVKQALAAELRSTQDTGHPMRYRLRKTSARLSTTKDIFETKDGAVARLIAVNDKALDAGDEQKEQARLDSLLADPGRQRHRKQAEEVDMARVIRVLRCLPDAFTYRYIGSGVGPTGVIEKFAFEPNPIFNPADLETQVLTAMRGEIWIDASEQRVARLEGHLEHDVDFGWGILGRLNKDGWVVIEQSDVGQHQWRIVRFQMSMSGRIVMKTKSFASTEEQSQFSPVPVGVGYAQAIHVLRSSSGTTEEAGR
jgi:hypothetical protein